jgi:multimeric flavodoxin WrbA
VNKIVILLGENRTPGQSDSHKVAVLIKDRLHKKDADIQIDLVSLSGFRIDMCTGCESCQRTGECTIQDDLADLKKIVLDADHIMIVSPIYADHIPGVLKNFIDRISYWMPIMNLLGKTTSSIVVASSAGQIYASGYLERTFQRFGTIHVRSFEISVDTPPMLLEKHAAEMDMLTDDFVDKVCLSLTHDFPLEDLDEQFLSFNRYKEIYAVPEDQDFFGNTWKSSPALQHNSFLDAFQCQRMKKMDVISKG